VDYGRASETVPAHDDAVSCLCLNGDTLVSGSWDSTVKVWKMKPTGMGKVPISDFIDSETEIRSVDINSNGNIVVSGSEDGSISFLDLRTQHAIRTVQGHIEGVSRVKFTRDDSRVVSCSEDRHVKVLDLRGTDISLIDTKESLKAMDTDGNTLFLGGENGIVRVWDMARGIETCPLIGAKEEEPISNITVSTTGSLVVASTTGGSLHIWRKP